MVENVEKTIIVFSTFSTILRFYVLAFTIHHLQSNRGHCTKKLNMLFGIIFTVTKVQLYLLLFFPQAC